ncbi:YbaB/EbfC family nucleoid-associated protein [Mycolicibacterium mageritense]|uniref:YbaB/EbfC family nucleoid-associated protein n=1 Tax=Mycolicibacterium mageritense TaxID=53462 RepID=UPI0023F566D8|nr:YbaB/EbfC family nucleoid-associated protein [Mycolicibacterium mageritense]
MFDSLDDYGKVDFVENDLGGIAAGLDRLIKDLSDIKVGARDPDGVVEVTLGYNGRLNRLWLDENVSDRYSNLELEEKLNQTTRDALEAIDEAWSEIKQDAINYLPPE